jgi:phosphate transport system substrate-binding protein
MWQKQQKYSPIVNLALLLVLASTPIAAILVSQFASYSQTEATKEPSFPLPSSIESNTIVRIDGSSSMARINESLKQSFEQKFSGAKVELATNGTDAAIKSVVDGKTDLAAIGRGLTQAELEQGLEQKRLRREKIAIVVGENNPFKGNITNQQFARMFRGEITNWSQIGGTNGKIRFIDRPGSSDTRSSLRNYPAFKAAKFATGTNATQMSTDDSAELVKQLGNDGIGYVIANQVSKVPGLRVLKLHQTLPNDARYPFSQPLVYAYKKNPSPGVAGFLGFAGAEAGTIAVEAARSAEALAIAQSVASDQGIVANAATPTPVAETTTQANTTTAATDTLQANTAPTGAALSSNTTSGDNRQVVSGDTQPAAFPWWLLLPITALGAGILWWLLGKGNKRSEALEGASTLPIAAAPINDALPKTTTLQGIIPTTTNSVDDVKNTDSNVSNIGGAALGGAALAGAATGIGLWPRLADGNIEAPSEDMSQPQVDANNQNEISADAEPVAVVMPTRPEVPNLAQVDSEPVIDVQLPNPENITPSNSSNWLDNMNAASGAAAGAGLWSRFANRDSNESIEPTNIEVEPESTASTNDVTVAGTPSIEQTEATTNLPISNQQPLPDVWEDTEEDTEEEPSPTGSNWLDNISLAGNNALPGGSAIASIETPSQQVEVPVEQDVLENAVDSSEVIETIYIDPATASLNTPDNQTPSLETTVTEQLPDVWQDNSQPKEQSGSNWLDNVRDTGASTLAGGAAIAGGAAAVGAGLWSKFANSGNDQESTNETNETIVDNRQQDLAAEVNIPEVTQPSIVEPTTEVDIPEVTQPSLVEPTAEVDTFENQTSLIETTATDEQLPDVWQDSSQSPEQSDSNWLDNIRDAGASTLASGAAIAGGTAAVGAGLWSRFANSGNDEESTNETNVTIVDNRQQDLAAEVNIPEIAQPNIVEPTAEVDIPEVAQPILIEPTTEVDIPEVTQPILIEPTAEVDIPEVAQPILIEPTAEVDIPEVAQPILIEPTTEVDIPEVAQPILIEPTTNEQIINAQEFGSEQTPESDSNWLSNTAEENAVIAGGAAAVGGGWLSSRSTDENQSNESNQENLELSDFTGNSSDTIEVTEAEILNVQEVVNTEVTQADINVSYDTSMATNVEPASTPEFNINPALAGGAAIVAGATLGAANFNRGDETDTDVPSQTPVINTTPVAATIDKVTNIVDTSIASTINRTKSHITFTSRTPKWAYIAWNIDGQDKQALSKDGAAQLALRLYDTTDTDLSYQTPQLVQQYECEEAIENRFVAIPASDRDYMAEIGYLTSDNQWLSISRSQIVRVFSRPHQEFWFEADAELIIHGATEPGSNVTISGQSVKLKPDGTFHLRIPFTEELIDYVMTAVAKNGEKAKTIHMHFEQNE